MSTAAQSPVYGDITDVDLNQELSLRYCSYKLSVLNYPLLS